MNKKSIAILGANGHIGKGLIEQFSLGGYENLYLFSRDVTGLEEFLKKFNFKGNLYVYDDFQKHKYDAIINCVGNASPKKIAHGYYEQMMVIESYDNLVLEYLAGHSNTRYFYLSSGAVYGEDFRIPVDDDSIVKLNMNKFTSSSCYAIAKINAEAKHRALSDRFIVDIRIFSYFSRYIDADAGFFLSDIIQSIQLKKKFITDDADIMRDYVTQVDLFNMISRLLNYPSHINDSLDIISLAPISKMQILQYFTTFFGLHYEIASLQHKSPTGQKQNYFAISKKASKYGYYPISSSIENLARETKFIL